MRLKTFFGLSVAALALTATPAFAQKSKDTLRYAVTNPFAQLSSYHLPVDEAAVLYREMYESLIGYDEYNKKVVPMLAKSWKIEPGVYEFELRDDIKFHNGNTFNADDVIATLKYVADPAVKLTFKNRYDWIKEVEKLGPHKIRIISKQPDSGDFSLLTYRIKIWDAETMAKLENVEEYGRVSPVGTGVYKAIQVDRNNGVIVERYDDFKTDPRKKAAIKRVHAIPMPDAQTQVAQLMTGGVEALRNVSPDTAKELLRNPNMAVTNISAPSTFYFSLDSQGVAGNKALTDVRVRRAIFMAIDRESIIKHLVPGGEVAIKPDGLCYATTIDCKISIKAPDYNPAEAKKLLAEAGYPNGFEFEYNVYTPMLTLGQAVAGDLLKVGIKAKIQSMDISLYRRKQGAGELQGLSVLNPTASHPTAANIIGIFFGGPAFQYYNDKVIADNIELGGKEFDDAKRADYYGKVFDQANKESYVFPVTSVPTVFAHSKDVGIEKDLLAAGDVWASSFVWK